MKRNLILIIALTIFTLNLSIIIYAHCGDTWTGKDGVLPLPVPVYLKDCAHPVNGVDTAGQIYKKLTYAHIYWLDIGHRQGVEVVDTGQGGLPNGNNVCTECWPRFDEPYFDEVGNITYWKQKTFHANVNLSTSICWLDSDTVPTSDHRQGHICGTSAGFCQGETDYNTFSSGCASGFIAVDGFCTRPFSFQQNCSPAEDPYVEDQCECVPLYQSPIIIDVLGDGFALTNTADGVDFNYSGHQVLHTSWIAANSDEAFLILDRNGNGTVDNGGELFGNFTPQPQPSPGKGRNGFAALGEYDTPSDGGNGDGRIDSSDSIFLSLRLWQDTNHNGVSEPSELHTLSNLGLTKLDLKYKQSKRTDEYGNKFRYRAKVMDVHGAQLGRWAWDVFFVTGP